MQILGRLDIVINMVIPYLIIAIMGSITARQLYIYYQQRRSIINTTATRRRARFRDTLGGLTTCQLSIIHYPKIDTHMTKLCLALCSTFLVMCLPSQINRLWIMLVSITNDRTTINKDLFLYQTLLLQLFFTRYAVNLPVYLIVSQSFRSSFMSVLRCACFCKRRRTRRSRYITALLQRRNRDTIGIML